MLCFLLGTVHTSTTASPIIPTVLQSALLNSSQVIGRIDNNDPLF